MGGWGREKAYESRSKGEGSGGGGRTVFIVAVNRIKVNFRCMEFKNSGVALEIKFNTVTT